MSVADELAPRLAAVLAPALGSGTAIEDLRTLSGGASRTTWAFGATTGGQRRSLILRIGPPDDLHAGMELEARAQAAAAAVGEWPNIADMMFPKMLIAVLLGLCG